MTFISELGQFSVAWRKTSSQPTRDVNSTPTKYSTYRVAQHDHISSREHAWLKSCKAQDCTSLSLKQMTSACHVSFFAAPDTDHKHKFSLTHFIHLSYLSDGLSFTNKPCDSRPTYTLRCSTAEWRINTNPISYKKSAGWSSKDWNSKTNWQRSAVEDAGQSSQDKWKSSKLRADFTITWRIWDCS